MCGFQNLSREEVWRILFGRLVPILRGIPASSICNWLTRENTDLGQPSNRDFSRLLTGTLTSAVPCSAHGEPFVDFC